MFIYIEIVKAEYYQRQKIKNKKNSLKNKDNNINNEKKKMKDKSLQHPVFPGGHPSKH